jgi:hypothetical protein
MAPQRIAHFWLVTRARNLPPRVQLPAPQPRAGFWSLLFLAQAMAEENLPGPITLHAFDHRRRAGEGRKAWPIRKRPWLLGPVRVIPRNAGGHLRAGS